MRYGKYVRCLVFMFVISMLTSLNASRAAAVELAVVARFFPEEGKIADAAIMEDGRLALLYPALGRIADYSLSGLLNHHITREGGENTRFIPTTCANGVAGTLAVFDEASSALFTIAPDGNITKGITLAYPTGKLSATALSRIGDLAVDSQGSIWALLPDRGVLAQFNRDGTYLNELVLPDLINDNLSLPTRFQFQPDGMLTFLDYHQGAVFVQSSNGGFQRLALNKSVVFDAMVSLQDYAIDQSGNVLLATYDKAHPLVLLVPSEGEMVAHPVTLNLPNGANRLACRYSAGKFIVWSREISFLVVIELR